MSISTIAGAAGPVKLAIVLQASDGSLGKMLTWAWGHLRHFIRGGPQPQRADWAWRLGVPGHWFVFGVLTVGLGALAWPWVEQVPGTVFGMAQAAVGWLAGQGMGLLQVVIMSVGAAFGIWGMVGGRILPFQKPDRDVVTRMPADLKIGDLVYLQSPDARHRAVLLSKPREGRQLVKLLRIFLDGETWRTEVVEYPVNVRAKSGMHIETPPLWGDYAVNVGDKFKRTFGGGGDVLFTVVLAPPEGEAYTVLTIAPLEADENVFNGGWTRVGEWGIAPEPPLPDGPWSGEAGRTLVTTTLVLALTVGAFVLLGGLDGRWLAWLGQGMATTIGGSLAALTTLLSWRGLFQWFKKRVQPTREEHEPPAALGTGQPLLERLLMRRREFLKSSMLAALYQAGVPAPAAVALLSDTAAPGLHALLSMDSPMARYLIDITLGTPRLKFLKDHPVPLWRELIEQRMRQARTPSERTTVASFREIPTLIMAAQIQSLAERAGVPDSLILHLNNQAGAGPSLKDRQDFSNTLLVEIIRAIRMALGQEVTAVDRVAAGGAWSFPERYPHVTQGLAERIVHRLLNPTLELLASLKRALKAGRDVPADHLSTSEGTEVVTAKPGQSMTDHAWQAFLHAETERLTGPEDARDWLTGIALRAADEAGVDPYRGAEKTEERPRPFHARGGLKSLAVVPVLFTIWSVSPDLTMVLARLLLLGGLVWAGWWLVASVRKGRSIQHGRLANRSRVDGQGDVHVPQLLDGHSVADVEDLDAKDSTRSVQVDEHPVLQLDGLLHVPAPLKSDIQRVGLLVEGDLHAPNSTSSDSRKQPTQWSWLLNQHGFGLAGLKILLAIVAAVSLGWLLHTGGLDGLALSPDWLARFQQVKHGDVSIFLSLANGKIETSPILDWLAGPGVALGLAAGIAVVGIGRWLARAKGGRRFEPLDLTRLVQEEVTIIALALLLPNASKAQAILRHAPPPPEQADVSRAGRPQRSSLRHQDIQNVIGALEKTTAQTRQVFKDIKRHVSSAARAFRAVDGDVPNDVRERLVAARAVAAGRPLLGWNLLAALDELRTGSERMHALQRAAYAKLIQGHVVHVSDLVTPLLPPAEWIALLRKHRVAQRAANTLGRQVRELLPPALGTDDPVTLVRQANLLIRVQVSYDPATGLHVVQQEQWRKLPNLSGSRHILCTRKTITIEPDGTQRLDRTTTTFEREWPKDTFDFLGLRKAWEVVRTHPGLGWLSLLGLAAAPHVLGAEPSGLGLLLWAVTIVAAYHFLRQRGAWLRPLRLFLEGRFARPLAYTRAWPTWAVWSAIVGSLLLAWPLLVTIGHPMPAALLTGGGSALWFALGATRAGSRRREVEVDREAQAARRILERIQQVVSAVEEELHEPERLTRQPAPAPAKREAPVPTARPSPAQPTPPRWNAEAIRSAIRDAKVAGLSFHLSDIRSPTQQQRPIGKRLSQAYWAFRDSRRRGHPYFPSWKAALEAEEVRVETSRLSDEARSARAQAAHRKKLEGILEKSLTIDQVEQLLKSKPSPHVYRLSITPYGTKHIALVIRQIIRNAPGWPIAGDEIRCYYPGYPDGPPTKLFIPTGHKTGLFLRRPRQASHEAKAVDDSFGPKSLGAAHTPTLARLFEQLQRLFGEELRALQRPPAPYLFARLQALAQAYGPRLLQQALQEDQLRRALTMSAFRAAQAFLQSRTLPGLPDSGQAFQRWLKSHRVDKAADRAQQKKLREPCLKGLAVVPVMLLALELGVPDWLLRVVILGVLVWAGWWLGGSRRAQRPTLDSTAVNQEPKTFTSSLIAAISAVFLRTSSRMAAMSAVILRLITVRALTLSRTLSDTSFWKVMNSRKSLISASTAASRPRMSSSPSPKVRKWVRRSSISAPTSRAENVSLGTRLRSAMGGSLRSAWRVVKAMQWMAEKIWILVGLVGSLGLALGFAVQQAWGPTWWMTWLPRSSRPKPLLVAWLSPVGELMVFSVVWVGSGLWLPWLQSRVPPM